MNKDDDVIKFESVADLVDHLDKYKPSVLDRVKWWLKDVSRKIKCWMKPAHQQLRDAIPREFRDISSLIVSVNFEFIKSYYENEMDVIDWDHNEYHQEFRDWINDAYAYITQERPNLEQEIANAYPPLKARGTYSELYAEVIRLEALLQEKDTAVLMEIVKRREMFWS